jgi:hypothetical protein
MGANTTVYVRVLRTHEDCLEVSAVTLDEAEEIAQRSVGVVAVLGSTYERDATDASIRRGAQQE